MRRKWVMLAAIVCCCAGGLIAWVGSIRARADRPEAEAPALAKSTVPLVHVVLFNTGVGYFRREGDVEGNKRLEITFPLNDLNDLLKSMTVDDGGKPGVISYDGADPVEQALKSFAVDLTGNPTLGQVLNQSRGEKVELTFDATGGTPAAPMTGTILGMESSMDASKEVHHLNLQCADGLRRFPLERVQRVRFLDPGREQELRRALGMLAAGNSGQRRRVWVDLRGDGKRPVKVSYVVEAPIWKATYRLNLDDKPTLEARAIVENTTEEDWKDVKVTLIAGRPITFDMDLSKPLFVPRPPHTPEFYASLQPPTLGAPVRSGSQVGGGFNLGGGGFNLGGGGFNLGGMIGTTPPIRGITAGMATGFNPWMTMGTPFSAGSMFNRYQVPSEAPAPARLTYEELLERRQEMIARRKEQMAEAKGHAAPDETSEGLAVDVDRIGEGFRRTIDGKVSVPRQTSAMLPLLKEPIEVTRFSVYNRLIHPRFAMHTLRIKNTVGQQLPQGPVSVTDAGVFVGDCKLPEMAPGEERLVSHAMDLGVEVRFEPTDMESHTTEISVQKGRLIRVPLRSRTVQYAILNRSKQPRTVVIEHPRATGWGPIGKARPAGETATHRRYEFKVPPGALAREPIDEQLRETTVTTPLRDVDNATLLAMLKAKPYPTLRLVIEKVLDLRDRVQSAKKALAQSQEQVSAVQTEQARLKERIDRLPEGSPVRKRLSEEHEQQEAQLDKLHKEVRMARETEAKTVRDLETFSAEATAK